MTWEHPAFTRAKALPEPLRAYFPKSDAEAEAWRPTTRRRALASRVLVVAKTRIECAWSAYIDAVPGENHVDEVAEVLERGCKLPEAIARILFPEFNEVPYKE
jgi:hypothetical protein